MPSGSYEIAADDLWPRTEESRLRIYVRRGGELRVLAATDLDGLGRTLRQLDEDERDQGGGRRLADLGAIGVLDVIEGRWLILPWQRPEGRTTFGPLPREVRP